MGVAWVIYEKRKRWGKKTLLATFNTLAVFSEDKEYCMYI